MLLEDKDEFPKMMSIAQSVITPVSKVTFPVIMDSRSLEKRVRFPSHPSLLGLASREPDRQWHLG